jgi:hypothetical protein
LPEKIAERQLYLGQNRAKKISVKTICRMKSRAAAGMSFDLQRHLTRAAASREQAWRIVRADTTTYFFDDMTADEQASMSRVAEREKLPLLLGKARQLECDES